MSNLNNKEKGHFRSNWLFYSLLIIAIGVSAFLWASKNRALNKQAKAFESEKLVMLDQVKETFLKSSEQQVDIMMKTFVWAVRSEMTRGNQEQVNQYFKQLVKMDKVDDITLVDTEGKILISTNKKNEGAMLSNDYSDKILEIEELYKINKSDHLVLAAPVLSFDSRLGTLIVLYKTDTFQLDAFKN